MWIGYVLVVALLISLTMLLDWLEPIFPLGRYPILYVVIVMIMAYLFGTGPAITGAALGLILFEYYFSAAYNKFWPLADTPRGWAGIVGYLLGMLLVSAAALYARAARARIQHLADLLQKYELLVRHAKDIILFSRCEDGQIMEANAAAVENYGYSREELLNMRVNDIRAPGIEPIISTLANEEEERGVIFETIHRRKDGSSFPVEVSSRIAFVSDDLILLNIIRDITDRKLAESAKTRLASIVDSSSDAIIGKSLDGTILSWNSGAAAIYGYTAEEAIGKPISILLPSDAIDDLQEILSALASGERIVNRESVRMRKDGKLIDVSLTVSPIKDELGNIIGASTIARDVTELIALRRQLENQVTLLQQALVPPLPTVIECCKVAAIYQAAFPGQDVGGDFYDVFDTGDEVIGAFIGDVSGKGIEAAALAAAARSTIRAFTFDLQSPDTALSRSNTVLYSQHSKTTRFITALLVLLNPKSGCFSYASAGHPPAAIWHKDGSVEFLPVHNPPLGLFEKQDFECGGSCLEPGDKMVLYTDGILEARRETELLDLEGIETALRQHGHKEPNELAEALYSTARHWAGGKLLDDVAILIIERNRGYPGKYSHHPA